VPSPRPGPRPAASPAPGPPAPPATIATAPAWLPWALLAFTLAAWLLGVRGDVLRPSTYAHDTWLADAFLHSQLHLRHVPEVPADLAPWRNRYDVVFGPLPAVVLMPLVALFGLATPDVLVLVITALAGVWAFHQLVRTVVGGDPALLACATLTFALGTAIHYGAPMGGVWLHTQITATTLQVFGLLAAARGRAWTSGVLLALGVLTRPPVALAAPFAWWLLAERPRPARKNAARGVPVTPAWGLVSPITVAILLLAAYNAARFGDPLDGGYLKQLVSEPLAFRIREHGQFSLAFLPENLFGTFLRPPLVQHGTLVPDLRGMGLVFTTPFLLLASWPGRRRALEPRALWNSALIAVPALLYDNDGSMQFGNRFALDWIVLGLLAATSAARRAPRWLPWALTAWGVVVGAWGLQWFRSAFTR
jgi:hypothetical protein